ncbi:holliday junction ATP-dependent DNA helicase RuvA [Firmicutes bacterium CAG:449]|nr:holliday junction ATP-dependent DNA helicase RuvA [Firmicutes bacterium CAG:449]
MYYYLKGQIVEVNDEFAVIDVNGVGYEFLIINKNDFNVGDYLLVYTLHIVREDDELFVGFKTIEEKNVFTKFISVKGIGPKTAINALKDTTIDKFKEMIINEDIKGLKKLSGIGPKAAGQIILDLKGSLKQSSLSRIESKTKFNKEQEDALSVLKSLGFKGKDIEDILNKLPEVLSASEYVNEVLKRLGNK